MKVIWHMDKNKNITVLVTRKGTRQICDVAICKNWALLYDLLAINWITANVFICELSGYIKHSIIYILLQLQIL